MLRVQLAISSEMKLKEYCFCICDINGLATCVISPEYYDTIADDAELLRYLSRRKSDILPYLNIIKECRDLALYLAFVYHETWIERYRWMPLFCYRKGETFYHVEYHSGWRCRECGCDNGAVLMPIWENDAVIYGGAGADYPEVPSIFKKLPCKKCGRILQNHLIKVECIEEEGQS